MKRLLLLPAAGLLASCNTPPFNVVSIRPIYGWAEGCNVVRVSGSGFGPDATLQIGGVEATIIGRGEGIDEGYWVDAVAPGSANGGSGYADVTINSAGQADTVAGAYYHVGCPQLGYVEYVSTDVAAAGDTIEVGGCGLDPTQVKAQIFDQATHKPVGTPIDLVSSCSTAVVTFTAPALTDGTYDLVFVDGSGTPLAPSDYPCVTKDTYYPCQHVNTLTYGGK